MEFQILFKQTLIVKHTYYSFFFFFHSEAYEIVLAVCTVLFPLQPFAFGKIFKTFLSRSVDAFWCFFTPHIWNYCPPWNFEIFSMLDFRISFLWVLFRISSFPPSCFFFSIISLFLFWTFSLNMACIDQDFCLSLGQSFVIRC